jgi:hypothetical protein
MHIQRRLHGGLLDKLINLLLQSQLHRRGNGPVCGGNFQSAIKGKSAMWKFLLTFIIICFIVTACANQATSSPTSAPSLDAHFPQYINTPIAYLDISIKGKLVLDNGCLRVSGVKGRDSGDNFLLIWDTRFSTRREEGILQVIDSRTNAVLASAGDFVEVSYGGDINAKTWKPIPYECPGPYYLVGETIKKIERP